MHQDLKIGCKTRVLALIFLFSKSATSNFQKFDSVKKVGLFVEMKRDIGLKGP